jgi:hypothetical protein
MENEQFHAHVGVQTVLPLFIFLIGCFSSLLFIIRENSLACIVMMLCFGLSLAYMLYSKYHQDESPFNGYVKDLGEFIAFGFSTLAFGFTFYDAQVLILAILFFYASCLVMGMARNWILKSKNPIGWPMMLNGIFFPLIYFFYVFYFNDPGNSIFLIYFVAVGVLAVSHFKFFSIEYFELPVELSGENKQKSTVIPDRKVVFEERDLKTEEITQRLDALLERMNTN